MAVSSVDAAIMSTKIATLPVITDSHELISKIRAETVYIESNLLEIAVIPDQSSCCIENQICNPLAGLDCLVLSKDAAGVDSEINIVEAAGEQSIHSGDYVNEKKSGVNPSTINCTVKDAEPKRMDLSSNGSCSDPLTNADPMPKTVSLHTAINGCTIPHSSSGVQMQFDNSSQKCEVSNASLNTNTLHLSLLISERTQSSAQSAGKEKYGICYQDSQKSDVSPVIFNSVENQTESNILSIDTANVSSKNAKLNCCVAKLGHVSKPSEESETPKIECASYQSEIGTVHNNQLGLNNEDGLQLTKSVDTIGMAKRNSISGSLANTDKRHHEIEIMSKSRHKGSTVDQNDVICSSPTSESHLEVKKNCGSPNKVLDLLDRSTVQSSKSGQMLESKESEYPPVAHQVSDGESTRAGSFLNGGTTKTGSERPPRSFLTVDSEEAADEETSLCGSKTKIKRNCSLHKGKKVTQQEKSGHQVSNIDSPPETCIKKAVVGNVVSNLELEVGKQCKTDESCVVVYPHGSELSEQQAVSENSIQNGTIFEDASIKFIGILNENNSMQSQTESVTPLGKIMQLVADMGNNLDSAAQKRLVVPVAKTTGVKLLSPVLTCGQMLLERRLKACEDGNRPAKMYKHIEKRNKANEGKLNKSKSSTAETIPMVDLSEIETPMSDAFKQKKGKRSCKVKCSTDSIEETSPSKKHDRAKKGGDQIVVNNSIGCDSIAPSCTQDDCIGRIGCEAAFVNVSVNRTKMKINTTVEDDKKPKISKRKTSKIKQAEIQNCDSALNASPIIVNAATQENIQNCDARMHEEKKRSKSQCLTKCLENLKKADAEELNVETSRCSLEGGMFPASDQAKNIKRADSRKKGKSNIDVIIAAVTANAQVAERAGAVNELAATQFSPAITDVESIDTSAVTSFMAVQEKRRRKKKNGNTDSKNSHVDVIHNRIMFDKLNQVKAAIIQNETMNKLATYRGASPEKVAPFDSSPILIVSDQYKAARDSYSENSVVISHYELEQKGSESYPANGSSGLAGQYDTNVKELPVSQNGSNLVMQQQSSAIVENCSGVPIKSNKRKRTFSKIKESCADTNLYSAEIPQIKANIVCEANHADVEIGVEKPKRCRKKMKTQNVVLASCSEKIDSTRDVCLTLPEGCHEEFDTNVSFGNIKTVGCPEENETATSTSINMVDHSASEEVLNGTPQTKKSRKPSDTRRRSKCAQKQGSKLSSETTQALHSKVGTVVCNIDSIPLSECKTYGHVGSRLDAIDNISTERVTDMQLFDTIKEVAEGSPHVVASDDTKSFSKKEKKKKHRKKKGNMSACVEDLLIKNIDSHDKICGVADDIQEKQFTCPSCCYKSNKKGQLRKHLSVHRVFACAHCGFTGNNHEELDEHMNVAHPSRCGRRLCKRCHMLFRTDGGAFAEHERSCTGDKFTWCCSFCGKQFKFVSAMKTHVRRWHANQTLKKEPEVVLGITDSANALDKSDSHNKLTMPLQISSDQCDSVEEEKLHATDFVSTQHCDDQAVAEIVAVATKETGILAESDRRFQCTHCEKTFKARRSMVHHRRMVHEGGQLLKRRETLQKPIDSIACVPVNDDFTENFQPQSQSSEDVQLLVGIETSTKTSVTGSESNTSGGIVDSNASLMLGKDDNSCDEVSRCKQDPTDELGGPQKRRSSVLVCKFLGCQHTFKRPGQLHRHEEKHASPDEKTFRCDWLDCRKRFLYAQNMHSHRRQHVDPKPYRCSQCSLAYWQKSSLRNHESKAHSNVTDVSPVELNQEKTIESMCTDAEHPSFLQSNGDKNDLIVSSSAERDSIQIAIEESGKTGKASINCFRNSVCVATVPIISENTESIQNVNSLEKVTQDSMCDEFQNSGLQKSSKSTKTNSLSKNRKTKRSVTSDSALQESSAVEKNPIESSMNTSSVAIQGSQSICQKTVSDGDVVLKCTGSFDIDNHITKTINVYEFCEDETVDIQVLKPCRGSALLLRGPLKTPTMDEGINETNEPTISCNDVKDKKVSKLKKRKQCKNENEQKISGRSESSHILKSVFDGDMVSDFPVDNDIENVPIHASEGMSTTNTKTSLEVDDSTAVASLQSKCKLIRKKASGALQPNQLLRKRGISGRFSSKRDNESESKSNQGTGRICITSNTLKELEKGKKRRTLEIVDDTSTVCVDNVTCKVKSPVNPNKIYRKVKPKLVKLRPTISKAESKKYCTGQKNTKSMRIKRIESEVFVETRSKTRFLIAEAEKQIASANEKVVCTTRKRRIVCEKTELSRQKKKSVCFVAPKKSVTLPVVTLSRVRKGNRKQVSVSVSKISRVKDKKPKCCLKKAKLLESSEVKPCSIGFESEDNIHVSVCNKNSEEIRDESLDESCLNADEVSALDSPNRKSTSDDKNDIVDSLDESCLNDNEVFRVDSPNRKSTYDHKNDIADSFNESYLIDNEVSSIDSPNMKSTSDHENDIADADIVVACESDRKMECELCELHDDIDVVPPAPSSPEPPFDTANKSSPVSPKRVLSPGSPMQTSSPSSEVSNHSNHNACNSLLQNNSSEENSSEGLEQVSDPCTQEPRIASPHSATQPNVNDDSNLEPALSPDEANITMLSQETSADEANLTMLSQETDIYSGVNENASASCSSNVTENGSLSVNSYHVPVEQGGSCTSIEAERSVSFVDMVHQAALPDTSMSLYQSNLVSPLRVPINDPSEVMLDRSANVYQDVPAYLTSYSSLQVRSEKRPFEGLASDTVDYVTGSSLPNSYFDSTAFISRPLPDSSMPSYGGTQLPSYVVDQESQLSKASNYLPYGVGRSNRIANNSQLVRESPVYVPPAVFPSDAFAKDLFGQYFPEASLPVPSSFQDQRASGNIISGYQQTSMITGGTHPSETSSDLFRRAYSGVSDSFSGSKSASVPSSQQTHYWMPSTNVDGRHHNPLTPQLVSQGSVNITRNSYASLDERVGSAELAGRMPSKRMEVGQSMFPGSAPTPAFDRYVIPSSAYSVTYNPPTNGPSSYMTHSGLSQSTGTSPRRLEDAYRQMADYRTLAAAQHHRVSTLPQAGDMYGGASAAALSSLDHYYYSARDVMYRSQQLAAAAAMPHAFMTQSSVAPQYAERTPTYGREAPSVYGQSATSYGLGYPETQYLPSSTMSGKSATGAREYFAPGVNPAPHSQDPYRHSVIYNMMPRYF